MHCFSHQKCQYTYWQNHRWLKNKIMCHWAHSQPWKKILTILQSCRAVPCEARRVVYLQHAEKRHLCRGGVLWKVGRRKWSKRGKSVSEYLYRNVKLSECLLWHPSGESNSEKGRQRGSYTLSKHNLKVKLFPKPFGTTIHSQYNMSSIYSLQFQYNHPSS